MEQFGASADLPSDEDVVVLIVGSDPDADRICSSLAARGADVQQLSTALAVDAVASANPDVVLLVGDAARQRGAQFRSQLVRRLRAKEVNLVVLVEEATTLASSTLRLVDRRLGSDAVAEQVLAAVQRKAPPTQGTLDEVAAMVASALQRPSEPPTSSPREPAKILMTSSRQPTPQARQTLRVAGAIPAPARSLPPRSSSLPQRLSMAPPTSLRSLAAHRIEIKPTAAPPPPPLPEATEVSLADMRIERDRESGEVVLQRSNVPPLPAAHPAPSVGNSTPDIWTPRDTPTSTVAAVELDVACASLRTPPRNSMKWVGFAGALAAGLALIAFASRSDTGDQSIAEIAPPAIETGAPSPEHLNTTVGAARTDDGHTASAARELVEPSDNPNPAQEVAVEAPLTDHLIDEDDVAGDEPDLVRARDLCNEGHALRNRGRLGLAEAKFLQALGLFAAYPRAVAGVVRVHLTRGDGAEAVRWAERLVEMQANRSNNQLLLGDAYALSGKHRDARRHWRKSAAFGNLAARKRLDGSGAVLAKPAR